MGTGDPIQHKGRYWYFVDNLVPEDGKRGVVRLWLALPFTRPGQDVLLGAISPEPSEIFEDELGGNRIARFELRDPPADAPLVFTVDFEVTASEVRTDINPFEVAPYNKRSEEYLRYTRSEPWIEVTPEIKLAARQASGGKANAFIAARGVFDFVIREMAYEYPDMEDRGAAKAFARKKGDCGEFSAVFVAMCRSLGIPARTVTCNWFTGSGHQWAEFLCPPHGWVPVDTSIAEAIGSDASELGGPEEMRKFCENRRIPPGDPGWLFGNLYANRLVVFVGTNVTAGDRTFGFLQPGGVSAWPQAFEAEGLGDHVVHNGFYLFDGGCDDPERAREHARKAMAKAWYDAGLPDKAEDGFRLCVAEKPEDAMSWFHLGQIDMNRGQLENARAAFASCIAGNAGSLQPVLRALSNMLRGHCFDLEGKRDKAVIEYQAVVDSGVDFQDARKQALHYLKTPFTDEE